MDYLHWIFLALYMTLAVAAMVTILLDNRQPAKTMAWVLVLMFLPVVGIILYFFSDRTCARSVPSPSIASTSFRVGLCWSLTPRPD